MANQSQERVSGLHGYYQTGRFGADNGSEPGVTLQEINELTLWQVAAWPEAFVAVSNKVAKECGVSAAPVPGKAEVGKNVTLLRTEPLKYWVIGMQPGELSADEGAIVDQSHSRTRLRVSGPDAVNLLNRHLPLDLRESAFPVGSVASSALHHIGITLWRNKDGYDLFIPRGFAASLWELITHSAEQFGYETLAV